MKHLMRACLATSPNAWFASLVPNCTSLATCIQKGVSEVQPFATVLVQHELGARGAGRGRFAPEVQPAAVLRNLPAKNEHGNLMSRSLPLDCFCLRVVYLPVPKPCFAFASLFPVMQKHAALWCLLSVVAGLAKRKPVLLDRQSHRSHVESASVGAMSLSVQLQGLFVLRTLTCCQLTVFY